jgi:hypothetical protein
MRRSPSKTKKSRSAAKLAPVGSILEMRPVRHNNYFPFVIILLFIAVAGITVAVLSFQKMSAALVYVNQTDEALAAAKSRADSLRGQITDLKALQFLASKKAEPPFVAPDQTWPTYSSKNLTLQYPADFEVVKATSSFPALTIKGSTGKIEIFRLADFDGKREVGRDDESLPKETLLVGTALEDSSIQPYDAWLYYGAGDNAAKATLKAIAASVKAL